MHSTSSGTAAPASNGYSEASESPWSRANRHRATPFQSTSGHVRAPSPSRHCNNSVHRADHSWLKADISRAVGEREVAAHRPTSLSSLKSRSRQARRDERGFRNEPRDSCVDSRGPFRRTITNRPCLHRRTAVKLYPQKETTRSSGAISEPVARHHGEGDEPEHDDAGKLQIASVGGARYETDFRVGSTTVGNPLASNRSRSASDPLLRLYSRSASVMGTTHQSATGSPSTLTSDSISRWPSPMKGGSESV